MQMPEMSDNERELSAQLFSDKPEGMMETIGALAMGALDGLYSEGMQHFAEHGAHEVAAALFGNGTGFVMYPGGGNEDQPSNEQELERGGRSM
jgi:hypothetical protein